ncbi:hypothetical protein NDU88_005504 [Pleurodeles waltl]|uniref:Uncharacterized protein n=1 Tax=Pleurodeles waltl TaxID=8319 RepID=A0AAV7QIH7_PLEWA|nr:hypothetical protein NDU88_005504 [Pleurodeles waltl]
MLRSSFLQTGPNMVWLFAQRSSHTKKKQHWGHVGESPHLTRAVLSSGIPPVRSARSSQQSAAASIHGWCRRHRASAYRGPSFELRLGVGTAGLRLVWRCAGASGSQDAAEDSGRR